MKYRRFLQTWQALFPVTVVEYTFGVVPLHVEYALSNSGINCCNEAQYHSTIVCGLVVNIYAIKVAFFIYAHASQFLDVNYKFHALRKIVLI